MASGKCERKHDFGKEVVKNQMKLEETLDGGDQLNDIK